MARTGRPCLLSPSLHKALVASRRGPLADSDVALKHGVSPETIRLWIKKGLQRDAEQPYLSFAKDWSKAKIERKEKLLAKVEAGAVNFKGNDPKKRGDWKAAVWQLERSDPLNFGSMVDRNGKQAGNIDIDEILRETIEQEQDLDAILLNPPPALIEAMRRNLPALRALLLELEEPALLALT